MSDRLLGLVLIVNTLMPPVFLVLVFGTGVFVWQTLEQEVVPRIEEIADDFNSVKVEAEKAADTVEDVVKTANARAREVPVRTERAVEALSPLVAEVQAVRKSVDSVVGPIADVRVVDPEIKPTTDTFKFHEGWIRIGPITYLTGAKLSTSESFPFAELRTPFDNIAVALDTISTEVGAAKASATAAAKEIAKLEPLGKTFGSFKNEFDSARTALVGISDALRGTFRPVVWAFGIFALLAVPWLAISYVTWSLARLKRGYALLTRF